MIPAKSEPRLSIDQQADYIEALTMRCQPYSGKNAGPVLLSLDETDVTVLRQLADRLKRMARHEDDIRRLVVGR